MRDLTTADAVRAFMVEVGRLARRPVNVYFTGGVTAVLHGWRDTTVDIDLKSDVSIEGLSRLKEKLGINIELASPDDFIPELPGWRERSLYIGREGQVSYFHYDPYAQVLAKLERGHAQDLADVSSMFDGGLVEARGLLDLFERVEPDLDRYPAIDGASFRRAVEDVVRGRLG